MFGILVTTNPLSVRSRPRPSMHRRSPDLGFSLLELMIVLGIISVIAAFAIPRLLRARATANETSAIAGMRAITAAENLYISTCGNGGYATSLVVLGTPPPLSTQAFISADMTTGVTVIKDAFSITLAAGLGATGTPNDCNGSPTQSAFYASATPQTFGVGGNRAFAVNTGHAIWETYSNIPPTEPFGPPATLVR